MNLLFTGRGTSGSFAIRGNQLGAALHAAVIPNALDVAGYRLAVIVKRGPADLLARLRRAGVPVVWDVVDSYPQPDGNTWDRATCMAWLADQVRTIKPAGIVAATRAMADDCGQFGVPVLWLPHHARPAARRNPIRDKVAVVGYEGGEQYLGFWRGVLQRACGARGWTFRINPEQLADADIVVAVRDVDGYAPRHWKSGVKLANAQGSGTPFIGCREAGYLETAGGAERWADNEDELLAALDALTPANVRAQVAHELIGSAPALASVARTYREWLEKLAA